MKLSIKKYISQLQPSLLGKLFYYCLPYRKKIVKANLDQVFQDILTESEKIKLAQAFYSHLLTSIGENIRMRFMSLRQIKAKAVVIGHEKALAAAKANKGVLILTGHFGNWEFAPIAGLLNFPEFYQRIHIIRKSLKFRWLEQWLYRRYHKAGLKVIAKRNAVNRVFSILNNNNAIIVVLDQHSSTAGKEGLAVEFFGKKAGTYRSLALLAQQSAAPVIPATSYRRQDGTHVLEFFDPLPWIKKENFNDEIYANTLCYNQTLEKLLLAHPEQWLWCHRRWKEI